jgi:CubicO group peptidase (beta-lactamase class C family)
MATARLAFVLLSLTLALSAEARVSVSKLSQAITQVSDNAVKNQKIVGSVIIVAQDGKVIYEKATGFFDRETKKAMIPTAVFRLASMTKPLVTVSALRLVEAGVLKLDDPVTKYLPEFKPKTSNGDTPVITIRHLLTHTSGLNYGFQEKADGPYHKLGVSDGLDDSSITLDEEIHRLGQAPLLFTPGEKWNYSLAIDVLGSVLEKVTGKKLSDVVADQITIPFEMRQTAFSTSDKNSLAIPYVDGQPPAPMKAKQEVPFYGGVIVFAPARAFDASKFQSGGGGMVGSAQDYLKFLEAVRKSKLVKNTDLIFKNQVGNLTVLRPGFGWTMIGTYLKDPTVAKAVQSEGTLGWGGVYGHNWMIDPKKKLSIVIMTNTALEGMSGQYPDDIRKAIYNNL